ncbi:hypothetical protein BASA50_009948 [Batrachochytrium salamandrivorans]|uniref:GDP-Man:Man(3)GlcNAc(2)-PP-Dol alpha-1,2-mannosyltransferase n=1 Tax=Batrachochytrium salamandrivorans TaxID=1357716 RepID=A0ABQ8EZX4_9FUNG|nr:hypothetical protein BASA61_006485 [Batrachochytrium salamandrivorans]KAH6589593.1 hypothetical protein BASA50_009948 [Batrachochytrium salamandrivorans]
MAQWPHSVWTLQTTVAIVLVSFVIAISVAVCTAAWALWPLPKQVQRSRLRPAVHHSDPSLTTSTRPLSVVGFFHPYCDAGGGGERVLWTAIDSLLKGLLKERVLDTLFVIYTCPLAGSTNQILAKVKAQFGIEVPPEAIRFAPLESWMYLEAKRYKRLTLLLQSLGSMITGWEAMQQIIPDVFVDTIGFAFIYPIAKFFGAKVIPYVHYPTISSDMIQKVQDRESNFNNSNDISNSVVLSNLKLAYYQAFSVLYGYVGSYADAVMVNSSWTLGHINKIWNIPLRTAIVFPPCDTTSLSKFSLHGRERVIISVAQFRPEKNHGLQIDAFSLLLQNHPQLRHGTASSVQLLIVGSVRNDEDAMRVCMLREQIDRLDLKDSVKILENVSYGELQSLLSKSLIGLHTMWNEHFGISIIEYMAAGVIPIASNSGGPMMDIVVSFSKKTTGFLASTEQEYADAMYNVLSLPTAAQLAIQEASRESVLQRFSASKFSLDFVATIEKQLSSIS